VTLLDVRNDYEVRVGSFRGALDPKTRKFTDLLDYLESHPPPKDRPLLTFCTGGIRCEKAVPYLRSLGYAQVFQLSGGILNYLAQMGPGFFEGECFVFDDRVALDGELQPTRRFVRCQQCGQPYARDGQCPDGHA
jgi:UPF0176 protein